MFRKHKQDCAIQHRKSTIVTRCGPNFVVYLEITQYVIEGLHNEMSFRISVSINHLPSSHTFESPVFQRGGHSCSISRKRIYMADFLMALVQNCCIQLESVIVSDDLQKQSVFGLDPWRNQIFTNVRVNLFIRFK